MLNEKWTEIRPFFYWQVQRKFQILMNLVGNFMSANFVVKL